MPEREEEPHTKFPARPGARKPVWTVYRNVSAKLLSCKLRIVDGRVEIDDGLLEASEGRPVVDLGAEIGELEFGVDLADFPLRCVDGFSGVPVGGIDVAKGGIAVPAREVGEDAIVILVNDHSRVKA